ncbi:MAG: class I SAM-dependent methyltransferase [Magnetococcales bacterium]|nr:class I SAM-dependent methyltransferase [Magnetococcales bacterium]
MNTIPDGHFESLACNELTYWWHCNRVEFASALLKRHVPDAHTRQVVDFGCGTGGFLHMISERMGFQGAIGLDRSATAITHARRFGENYHLRTEEGEALPSGTDLIFLMDVLEHIDDDVAFLRNLFAMLPEHGLVLISVPAMPVLYSQWDRQLGHFRRHTRAGLEERIVRAGGRCLAITYCFSYLVAPALWRRLQDSRGMQGSCEFPPTADWLGGVLKVAGRWEAGLGSRIPLPFGTSLFALVRAKQP